MEVYRACTKCLQQKMPTNNPLLCPMSSLDPTCHKHEVTLRFTKKLPSDAPNVLTEDECEKYEVEVHNFHSDRSSHHHVNGQNHKYFKPLKL